MFQEKCKNFSKSEIISLSQLSGFEQCARLDSCYMAQKKDQISRQCANLRPLTLNLLKQLEANGQEYQIIKARVEMSGKKSFDYEVSIISIPDFLEDVDNSCFEFNEEQFEFLKNGQEVDFVEDPWNYLYVLSTTIDVVTPKLDDMEFSFWNNEKVDDMLKELYLQYFVSAVDPEYNEKRYYWYEELNKSRRLQNIEISTNESS